MLIRALFTRRSLSALLAVFACVSAVCAAAPASAAELWFANNAYVRGSSTLGTSTRYGYRLLNSGPYYGVKLSGGTGAGYSKATSELEFHGPEHSRNLHFWTLANPDNRYSGAQSEMYTTTEGNGGFRYVQVAVWPIDGERYGQPVQVRINVSHQSEVYRVDGTTRNYFAVYVDGAKRAEKTLTRTTNGSQTFTVDTTLGSTIWIAIGGYSHSTKTSRANQVLRVNMEVPVRVF